jgi:iron complex transport system ATP-binding protein
VPVDDEPIAAVSLDDLSLSHDGGDTWALRNLSWQVMPGQRWAVLGPNGCGKSTLVQTITGWLHASNGDVALLGARLGQGVDWRRHRERIGVVSAAFAKQFRPEICARDIVMTAVHAALEPWWHQYSDDERSRAVSLLVDAGFGYLVDRPFGALSEGERQQVQLARTLMGRAELLVLDEPAAGLDLGARERFVQRLAVLAAGSSVPSIVLVTHHLEEIPPEFTHALLLRAGTCVAQGPIADVLTSANVSTTFGLSVRVVTEDGRYTCRIG